MVAARASHLRRASRDALLVGLGAALAVALVSCSSGSSKASSGGATTVPLFGNKSSTAPGAGSGNAQSTKTVPGSVRVVNLYAPGGKPQAIDVYDNDQVDQNPKPVATDLKYGTVSKTFSLHVPQYGTASDVSLYGVAAGTKPTTMQSFHSLNPGGFSNGADVIDMIGTDDSAFGDVATDPLAHTSTSIIYETDAGNQHGGPTVTAPPAGKADIVGVPFAFENVKFTDGSNVGVNLFVDGACAAPSNSDQPTLMIPVMNGPVNDFVVAPGSHTLEVYMAGSSLPVCTNMTPKLAKTTVDVASGKTLYAFVYGTVADPKILTFAGH